MYVEQLYTGCLAEAAYYIESEGEAAIIDPLRETEPYKQLAEQRGAKIKYVFETHFHADFVSGHVDLAKETDSTIVYGPNAKPSYDVHVAEDGEVFKIGKVKIKVLHTPGHTLESSCYLLKDENGKDSAVFTGDTLFVGEVGRPDLAVKGEDITVEDLAGHLYDSLHDKILPLADDVTVYPGHGAGSACGKNIGSESYTTIGKQRAENYALQPMEKAEFIAKVTDGIKPPPQYFPKNAKINMSGYDNINDILKRNVAPLTPEAVETEVENGALLIDTRNKEDIVKGYVPGAYGIGLDGSYAVWIGTLVEDLNRRLVVVAEAGKEEEAILRLARVGYENVAGYLEGGVEAWRAAGKPVATIESISADEMATVKDANVIDVRKEGEYQSEHVEGAENYPLDYIFNYFDKFDKSKTYYAHCKSGYRSVVGITVLKANGFDNFVNVEGGFEAMKETSIPVTNYVCPSELA